MEMSLQRLRQKGNLMVLFLQPMGTHLSRKSPRMVIIRFLIFHTLQIPTVSTESDSKFVCSLFLSLLTFDQPLFFFYSIFFSKVNSLVDGSSGSDKNNSESGRKQKTVPRREIPAKPARQSVPIAAPAPQSIQVLREQQKESNFDSEKLASARKRLQENYKEAENAKKQRTIQVMDIHQIPKPKNAFFARNKAGGSQGRHW
uniref:Uncharacterized protein MANES_12G149500 n=1 Tax=Rhizophora mucronata TaxID=61149 RepID=A0A2P2LBQ2_RHIMU